MNILVNCSNLKKGGGVQVADSVCGFLGEMPEHRFTVVLADALKGTAERIKDYPNVEVISYNRKMTPKLLLTGRDAYLDEIIKSRGIEGVLTVFGPSVWCPRCWHVAGFARAQLVVPESPYFKRFNTKAKLKQKALNRVMAYFFKKGVDVMWTENPMISERVRRMLHVSRVATVTNTYNQIFDEPTRWQRRKLPTFDGARLLSVNAYYDHKNLEIAIDAARVLRERHPDFKFRFVLTIDQSTYPAVPAELVDCFEFLGRVDITEVPSLYEQSAVCFQPTLLECFTATYAEAMRMGMPIVTTDLEFAHGLCGDAAAYYSALDAEACAEALYRAATDAELRQRLAVAGKKQLATFDTPRSRAHKLIELVANRQTEYK